MIYKAFQDLQLSQLGFGTMRLPLREDKSIDEELAAAMTDAAIRQGVNYFDTAWSYHSGKSETVIGKILSLAAMSSRLSCSFLPLQRPSSILNRPSFK